MTSAPLPDVGEDPVATACGAFRAVSGPGGRWARPCRRVCSWIVPQASDQSTRTALGDGRGCATSAPEKTVAVAQVVPSRVRLVRAGRLCPCRLPRWSGVGDRPRERLGPTRPVGYDGALRLPVGPQESLESSVGWRWREVGSGLQRAAPGGLDGRGVPAAGLGGPAHGISASSAHLQPGVQRGEPGGVPRVASCVRDMPPE